MLRTSLLATLICTAAAIGLACTQRQAGSSEIFGIQEPHRDTKLYRFLTSEQTYSREDRIGNVAGWGDRVRSNDDVVTIAVHSAYIHSVPLTLPTSLDGRTGYDLLLFAEVQENSAEGYNSPVLTSIIYSAKDVQVPGVVNFTDAVAYGPTLYKGSPLKVKFTLMLLVRNTADQEGQVIDIVGSIFGQAAPQYAAVASAGVNVIRAILEAQPDVSVFDFETTFYSDQPEDLIPPILANGAGAPGADATKSAARGFVTAVRGTGLVQGPAEFDWTKLSSLAAQKFRSEEPKLGQEREDRLTVVATLLEDALREGKMEEPTIIKLREKGTLDECAAGVCEILDTARVAARKPAQIDAPKEPGERIEVLGHREWDKYFPWLTNAFYAIVETQPRGHKRLSIDFKQALRLHGQYVVAPDLDDNKPIDANHIVFIVLPGQIEQQNETLRAASQLNRELLVSLTRSDESMAQAWDDIKSNSKKMVEAILKVRAEHEARRLRRKAENCQEFVNNFNARYKGLVGELIKSIKPEDSIANVPETVLSGVLSSFVPKSWAGKDSKCESDLQGIIDKAIKDLPPTIDSKSE